MKNALVFFSLLITAQIPVTAQIGSTYYLPRISRVKELRVDSLTCANSWTEKKKGKTETRIDHTDLYTFNTSGHNTQYLLVSEKDNHILERWNYVYDLNDSLVSFTRSHFGEPDKISSRSESTYTPLNNGWTRLTVIDSSLIGYEDYKTSPSRREKFILVKNGSLVADSTITQYGDFPPRTVVKNYFYHVNGSPDYTAHKMISAESTRMWKTLYEYDEKGRVREIFFEENGEKNSQEKWEWDDKKHELRIHSENSLHKREQIEYFRYDEKNQLIEYSNDLNDDILRMYEFAYYDNGLLKSLITIAPKDDWLHTKEYTYSFREI